MKNKFMLVSLLAFFGAALAPCASFSAFLNDEERGEPLFNNLVELGSKFFLDLRSQNLEKQINASVGGEGGRYPVGARALLPIQNAISKAKELSAECLPLSKENLSFFSSLQALFIELQTM
ncbi:MAG: hypothetical protein WCG05_01280 [Alphaproteobacteria bacterium]